MLVDEWVTTLWSILNVRDKTLRDYKHLYKRHLQPVIGSTEINLVVSRDLQVKLLTISRDKEITNLFDLVELSNVYLILFLHYESSN
jgi:hypothetical protein